MTANQRLASLDAYRGVTMLYMASEIWRLPELARQYPGNAIWQAIYFNTSHAEWTGGSAWDMIQPSFMFMVGIALPWSVARRRAEGQTLGKLWMHAFWRALLLVALGIFLRSISRPMTYFTFEDVLTQIGLGYPFLFLLAWTRPRWQALAAGLILAGYWAAFALYPAPDFAAHWTKNANLASTADQWFLNLFPREQPFVNNFGGYQTLNFVPSLATMIFGLLAGGVLREGRNKVRTLVMAGVCGIAVGWLLGVTGICPVVKRIWTPSWTLYAGGWTCLILAAFYWVIDVRGKGEGWKRVQAVGRNSIAMYCMVHLWDNFLATSVKTHFGWNVLSGLSPVWMTSFSYFAAWLFLWWVCIWMDRRGLYIRL